MGRAKRREVTRCATAAVLALVLAGGLAAQTASPADHWYDPVQNTVDRDSTVLSTVIQLGSVGSATGAPAATTGVPLLALQVQFSESGFRGSPSAIGLAVGFPPGARAPARPELALRVDHASAKGLPTHWSCMRTLHSGYVMSLVSSLTPAEVLWLAAAKTVELQVGDDQDLSVTVEGTTELRAFAARLPPEVAGSDSLRPAPGWVVGVERPVEALSGNPLPRYPERLEANRVDGEVTVRFIVDTAGRVVAPSYQVIQASDSLFAYELRKVLPKWKFKPLQVCGRKVNQTVTIPFEFKPLYKRLP